MKILKDIAYAINRYQAREIEVLTNPVRKPSKQVNRYWEFYVGLREDRWKTEEEAACHFGMAPGKNFNRLKNEVKRRLLNSLLFTDINIPEFSDYRHASQELVRLWAVAEALRRKGAAKAFLEIAEKCLNNAIRLENLEMIVAISRLIRGVTLPRNLKQEYLRACKAFDEYWPAFLFEVVIQNEYENLIQQLINHKGFKKEFAPLAEELTRKYEAEAKQYPYVYVQYYFRLIAVYAKIFKHDWAGGLDIANGALEFFYGKPLKIEICILAFNHQKTACLVMLGRHEEARETIRQGLELIITGSPLWFKNRELATINALYAGNYPEAWQIAKSAWQHERLPVISPLDQESWRVYQGYLLCLVKMGKMDLSPREKGELPRFRLGAWLNDLPLYSQDKRGANIPVLILQALFLLLEERLDEFDKRVEALRKYRQRNLDPASEHFRTDCFIRLLELIPAYGYDLQKITERAQPLLDKLQSVSVDILDRGFEVEVLPYERQWNLATEMLARISIFSVS